MPFQAVGGLNVWTTRLPSAIGGVATVLLAWWVGRRMFGPRVGLVTAALLAIDPTHVQMSRLGHEASITPLLTLVPLAALIWAGFPLFDANWPACPLRDRFRPGQLRCADRIQTGPTVHPACCEPRSPDC